MNCKKPPTNVINTKNYLTIALVFYRENNPYFDGIF